MAKLATRDFCRQNAKVRVTQLMRPTNRALCLLAVTNVAWRTIDNLHVIMFGKNSPTDHEWRAYIDDWKRYAHRPNIKVLVYSFGGNPTGSQRHDLLKTMSEPVPTAVVTTSPLARVIGLALRAANPAMLVVSPADEYRAYDHLRMTLVERKQAAQLRDDLSRQLQAQRKAS